MRVLVWSDLPIPSGFGRISRDGIARPLVRKGHEVAAISMMYQDGPHGEPYFVWSAAPPRDLWRCSVDIIESAKPDVLITCQDFPYHYTIWWGTKLDFSKFAWVFVTPIDGDPIAQDWLKLIDFADGAMVISQFGVDAVRRAGKHVDLCPVGVDANEFKPATVEEKAAIRVKAGLPADAWIVGMFSQNQGRKNIPGMMEEFRDFCMDKPANVLLYLDMDKEGQMGWPLLNLAGQVGLPLNRLVCKADIEARVPAIRERYCLLDMHGVPAFREGLGLPLMESMACKIPTFAVDWSSGTELMGEGKGYLIPRQEYMSRGTWGGARDAHPVPGAMRAAMEDAYRNPAKTAFIAQTGYEWAVQRTWDKCGDAVNDVIVRAYEKKRQIGPVKPATLPPGPMPVNAGEQRSG